MKTSEKEYNRTQKYLKDNYQWVNVNFSKKSKDDMVLLEWLKEVGESKAQYIKRLIREDMNRSK